MIPILETGKKKVVDNPLLLQNGSMTAGRQNLLSSIWGGRKQAGVSAMPNGDPPSLMLWGDEDDMSDRRYARRS